MKKTVKVLLTVVLALVMTTSLFVLIACDNEATCLNGEHMWDNGTVITPATCTTKGEKTFICEKCGERKIEEIDYAEHTWNSGEVTTTADCATEGETTFTCAVCNATKTEKISTTAHRYGELIAQVPATCAKEGVVAHYQCSTCHSLFNQNKEQITEQQLVIAATGEHTASEYKHDAETHWYECVECQQKYGDEQHSFVEGKCVCGQNENGQLEPFAKAVTVVFAEVAEQKGWEGTSTILDTETVQAEDIVIAFATNEASTAIQYYTNGSNLRVYNQNSVTFTVPDGMVITKIEFKVGENDTARTGSFTVNTGSYSNLVWTGEAQTVILTNGATQLRATQVQITYGTPGAEVDPGPNPDNPVDPGAKGYYVKVTSVNQLVSGAKYLIVYEIGNAAFDGSLDKLDATSNFISVTISDNKIEATEEINNSNFTITAVDGKFTVLAASSMYIGNSADSNSITSSESAQTNTITFDSEGNVNIIGEGGCYLRYNSTNGQYRFRYYKSGTYTNQQAIQLYMLQQG